MSDAKRELEALAERGEQLRAREEVPLVKLPAPPLPQTGPTLTDRALRKHFFWRNVGVATAIGFAPLLGASLLFAHGGWPLPDLLMLAILAELPFAFLATIVARVIESGDARRAAVALRALPFSFDVEPYFLDLGIGRPKSKLIITVEFEEQTPTREQALFESAIRSLGADWNSSWEERGARLRVLGPPIESPFDDNAPVHAALLRFLKTCAPAFHRARPIIKLSARIEPA